MSNFWDFNITSDYGQRTDPFTKEQTNHNGIDFALPLGTPVYSNVSGNVVLNHTDSDGYGNYVVIRDGTGKLHYYAHLQKSVVGLEVVNVGDVIGYSGSTGRSTGPHLHYEVRESDNKTTVDPGNFITTDSLENYKSQVVTEDKGWLEEKVDAVKGKFTGIIFEVFKYLCIILLIVLVVYFLYKSIGE